MFKDIKKVISLLLLILLPLGFINIKIIEPRTNDPKICIKLAKRMGELHMLLWAYDELRSEDPHNIDYHLRYINLYYKEYNNHISKKKLEKLIAYYEKLSNSTTSADLGNICLAYIYEFEAKWDLVDKKLDSVKNKRTRYYNLVKGFSYEKKQLTANANLYYIKEQLSPNGNKEDAIRIRAELYYNNNEKNKLAAIINDKDTRRWIPPYIIRKHSIYSKDLFLYLESLYRLEKSYYTLMGFLSALLITLVWMMYLRRLDIFERDRWGPILITFVLGVIITFFTSLVYDFYTYILGFELSYSNWVNDLLYSIFGIGLIEGFIKLIPFLIMLKLSIEINEPYDYILYASVSALGFACLENIMYFDGTPGIVHGRSVLSVLAHMICSSIVAYGFILSKYRNKRNRPQWLYIVGFLLLASLVHGMYDFLLFYHLRIFFYILFLIMMRIWALFIRNALNNSEFFTYELEVNGEKLRYFLIMGLIGILMAEYVVSGINYSYISANQSIIKSILTGSFVIFILSTKLSKLQLAQNYWIPIKIKIFDKRLGEVNTSDFVGQEITIDIFPKDAHLRKYIKGQITGRIIDRISLEDKKDWPFPVTYTSRMSWGGQKVATKQLFDPYWLLVELDDDLILNNFCKDHILVKYIKLLKSPKGHRLLFRLVVIPELSQITSEKIVTKDLKFIGRILGW